MNYRRVAVWSRAQRTIHWVMAFSVLLQIPLGLFILFSDDLKIPDSAVDAVMKVHAGVGAVLILSVLARLVYLFTGPPSSGWRDTVPHTKEQLKGARRTLSYYLSGFKGAPPLYLAHNPFAGIFYTILFAVLISQGSTGSAMFLLHGPGHEAAAAHAHAGEQAAPAAPEHGAGEIPEWMEDVHALGAFVIIAIVLGHFAALAAHDITEARGLVSSMISGGKFFDEEELKVLDETGETREQGAQRGG